MIHITKNGFKCLEWEGKEKGYVEQEWHPIAALREGVTEIEDGVTLGDLILFTAQDDILNLFLSDYSSCPIDRFADAVTVARENPVNDLDDDDDDDDDPLDYCTVVAYAEVTHHGKKYKVLPEHNLDFSLHFSGFKDTNPEESYSLSFGPMSKIHSIPFRLSAKNQVLEWDYRPDPIERKESVDLHYCFSLLDILDAILYDVSFYGGPEEAAVIFDDLKQMAKDVTDGTAKTVPFSLDELTPERE